MTHQALRACAGESVLCLTGELHNAFRDALRRNQPQGGVLAFPKNCFPCPRRADESRDRARQAVVASATSLRPDHDRGGMAWTASPTRVTFVVARGLIGFAPCRAVAEMTAGSV